MNYMQAAFAPVEAENRSIVHKATWGHLAPKRHKTYTGHIVFALGCYGSDSLNPTVLENTLDLEDSPWFFNAMDDFLRTLKGEDGGVYRWDGSFKNYEFTGTVRRLTLT